MARLLWLPEVLANAGLTVHLYDGWKTRGLESFGPVLGVICHGTGGSINSTDADETRTIAITGSNTATAPIAQLYQSRSGAWWVLASGTCTGVKTGTGGPLEGYGDDAVLQIEAQHHPTEPWTEVQYRSYVAGVASLVRHLGLAVAMVVGHGEHQPGEKTDPWFDMNQFRREVAAILNGDDMLEGEQAQALDNANKATWYGGTSMGEPVADEVRVSPKDGYGNSVVDQLAELRAGVKALKLGGVDVAALAEALAPHVRAVVREELDKTRLGSAQ